MEKSVSTHRKSRQTGPEKSQRKQRLGWNDRRGPSQSHWREGWGLEQFRRWWEKTCAKIAPCPWKTPTFDGWRPGRTNKDWYQEGKKSVVRKWKVQTESGTSWKWKITWASTVNQNKEKQAVNQKRDQNEWRRNPFGKIGAERNCLTAIEIGWKVV